MLQHRGRQSSVKKCRKLLYLHDRKLSRVLRTRAPCVGKLLKTWRHLFGKVCRQQPVLSMIGGKNQKRLAEEVVHLEGQQPARRNSPPVSKPQERSKTPLRSSPHREKFLQIPPATALSKTSSFLEKSTPKIQEAATFEFEPWPQAL